MGLLDQFFGNADQTQALGLLGAQMMAGNTPQGFAQAQGLLADAPRRRMQEQLAQMQFEQHRMALDKAKREAENEQGMSGLMAQYFNAGGPAQGGTSDVNAALPADLRIGAQSAIPARAPQFDVRGFTGAAMGKGYMNPLEALKLQKAYSPESQVNKLDVKDFEPASVAKFQQTGNYADLKRMDKLHFGDTGGALVGVNPFTGEKIAGYDKTQSPDSRASNALGWANNALTRRGQDLVNERAREANGAGKAPAGYRFKADGSLEAIPGGPADIKAGELGAKTRSRAEHAVGQANVVIGAIDEALGKAGFFETGLTGAVMGSVPGTDAYDLRGTVDTVKANIGFDSLQKMREMSPTGGALGQVAVQELNMLQSTVSNMNPNQSQAVLKANLLKAKKHYNNWKEVMQKAGGLEPDTTSVTPSGGAFSDPGKEQRYQAWKRSQGK
jgi:hypothetical protein